MFFLILTILAIYSLYRTYSDVQTKAKTIGDLALSVAQLKEDNKLVKQDIASKKTRDFIEFEAVSKLGLAKENQEVIIISNSQDNNKEVEVLEANKIIQNLINDWVKLFLKNNPFRY